MSSVLRVVRVFFLLCSVRNLMTTMNIKLSYLYLSRERAQFLGSSWINLKTFEV